MTIAIFINSIAAFTNTISTCNAINAAIKTTMATPIAAPLSLSDENDKKPAHPAITADIPTIPSDLFPLAVVLVLPVVEFVLEVLPPEELLADGLDMFP